MLCNSLKIHFYPCFGVFCVCLFTFFLFLIDCIVLTTGSLIASEGEKSNSLMQTNGKVMEDWATKFPNRGTIFFGCMIKEQDRVRFLIVWMELECETFCFITAYIYNQNFRSTNFLSFIPLIPAPSRILNCFLPRHVFFFFFFLFILLWGFLNFIRCPSDESGLSVRMFACRIDSLSAFPH